MEIEVNVVLCVSVNDGTHDLHLVHVEFVLCVSSQDGHGPGDLSVHVTRVTGRQHLQHTCHSHHLSYHTQQPSTSHSSKHLYCQAFFITVNMSRRYSIHKISSDCSSKTEN